MANNLSTERCEDLSLIYWLRGKFSGTTYVNVLDGFPESDLVLPSIAVEWEYAEGFPLEIGNRTMLKERQWYIDVFVPTKGQRDEYAYKIFGDLDEGIPVYNYNEGFPPDFSPSQIGTLIVVRKRVTNTRVLPELVDSLYYRATVLFVATYDRF